MTYFPAENMCLSSLSWENNIEEDSQINGAFLSGKCKVSMIGLTAKKKKKVYPCFKFTEVVLQKDHTLTWPLFRYDIQK